MDAVAEKAREQHATPPVPTASMLRNLKRGPPLTQSHVNPFLPDALPGFGVPVPPSRGRDLSVSTQGSADRPAAARAPSPGSPSPHPALFVS